MTEIDDVVQLIEFPDTDVLATSLVYRLVGQPAGVDVATQLPSPIPDRFIRCFTIVGNDARSRRVTECRVIARVYDTLDNETRCSEVARRVSSALRAAPEIPGDSTNWISEPCQRQGPYPIQDPEVPNRSCFETIVTWTVHSDVTTINIGGQ